MSYHYYSTYGLGVCVDDIKTTPEKLLKLAALKDEVLKDVRNYLDEIFDDGYKDEDLTMEDFDDLEGDYCERGVAYVLYQVIDEIRVEFADDFDGVPYILYTPTFPWYMDSAERDLTYEDVVKVFKKYIKMLTDEPVNVDFYNVENGG